MKRHTKARLIAATILIIAFATYSHFYRTAQEHMGRDAFLAYHAKRYETFLRHPSIISEVAMSVFSLGLLFTIYEGLVIGLMKVVSDDRSDDEHI